MHQWALDHGKEGVAEVAAALGLDVFVEIAADVRGVCGTHGGHLERVERGEDLDEGLFVGAEALHCFAECIGLRAEVTWCGLTGDIA